LAKSRRLAVLCPPMLPRGPWRPDHRLGLRSGACRYLLSVETHRATVPFHIIFGGRCGEFPLTQHEHRWPAEPHLEDDLGLIGARPLKPGQTQFSPVRPEVLRPASIAGHRGLLLRIPGYPDGGLHGGHLAAIWNQNRDGYVVSAHFEEPVSAVTAQHVGEVLKLAAIMSEAPPSR
jgi:hypothetical protein